MYNRREGRSCIFGRPNSTGAARFGQPKPHIYFNWEDFTMATKNTEIMSASTMALAMNERFSALKSEALKGALLIIGKAQDKAGLSRRESAFIVGHAIHDITAGKVYEADGFKNAAEAVSAFFTDYSPSRANQLAKLWEGWGDVSKLSDTDKAIYQSGTSAEALITLNQVTEAQRAEAVKNKPTPYFTAAEAKALRDSCKEPKSKVLKHWARAVYVEDSHEDICGVDWIPWTAPDAPDNPADGAFSFKNKNGDYVYIIPVETFDGVTMYEPYTLREVKPEKKTKAPATPANPSDILKNMTAEQKRSLIDALMESLEE